MEKDEFQNKVYKVLIDELERLEYMGAYRGNGHHLTQKLCDLLWEEFKDNIDKT